MQQNQKKSKVIQLSHGGGGQEMNQLIQSLFLREFNNSILDSEEDAAVLKLNGLSAFTTDSFTVSPLFFSGGDIGKLAIAGTANDLSMMGAKPEYLSCGFIIEEGFAISDLKTIVRSMVDEMNICGAKIVCGDTKVVPKGSADGIFINTSGIGSIQAKNISIKNIELNDAILVSRDIGRHGATILMAREGLTLESNLTSDCAVLWPVIEQLIDAGINIHCMRDATRGGLAAVLNEWSSATNLEITIEEEAIPICEEVMGLCELYGFDPLDLANEGTCVFAIPQSDVEKALKIIRSTQQSPTASVIGNVSAVGENVILKTPWGTSRYLDWPQGELLPRIC